ncbi:MAG: hypothetical protein NT080_02360 [Spirochaetes bacterium]|nr:hypothetical protein [Spirochaetota bacterium]
MGKILVAYATQTGSTAEVAREIARILEGKGRDTEVLPIAEVKSLDGYSGVVVGAPVQGMRWKTEAEAFVGKHRDALSRVPTAFFLLSAALTGGRPFWRKKVLSSLDAASAGIHPVKTGFFAGRMASEPPLILRLVFGIKKGTPKDGRDWDAIRAWAGELSGSF